jgi:cytochrome oxidase assembly protein ShyY1
MASESQGEHTVIPGFRPGWVPTAFLLFGVALTWSLGFWQLGRHQEKQALKAAILAGMDQPVLTGEQLVSDPVGNIHFRKVLVQGTFVPPQALMAARSEFDTAGYGVVQPLQLEGGTLLLVDRGWVPRDGLDEALRRIDTGTQTVTLAGQIRPVQGEEIAGPLPDRPGRPEAWPPGSWPALWARLPSPKVDGVVLAGEPLVPGESKRRDRMPVDGYDPLPPTRDSLSYAFQWWIFGGVLITVWVALGVTRGRPQNAR